MVLGGAGLRLVGTQPSTEISSCGIVKSGRRRKQLVNEEIHIRICEMQVRESERERETIDVYVEMLH